MCVLQYFYQYIAKRSRFNSFHLSSTVCFSLQVLGWEEKMLQKCQMFPKPFNSFLKNTWGKVMIQLQRFPPFITYNFGIKQKGRQKHERTKSLPSPVLGGWHLTFILLYDLILYISASKLCIPPVFMMMDIKNQWGTSLGTNQHIFSLNVIRERMSFY